MLHIILVSLFPYLVLSLAYAPKLMIISFDGFRYNEIDPYRTPNMYKWAKGGAWFTNGIKPQYATFTAVNLQSIATGLYAESHGIVSNKFYDYSSEELFQYWNDAKNDAINPSPGGSWFRGEPIWVTNQKNNHSGERNSACLYWPFCEVRFTNAEPPLVHRKWEGYRTYDKWMDDVDEIVDLFTREVNPVNFAAWYIREPDKTLHRNGFYNGHYDKMLTRLDNLIGYFVKAMERSGLDKKVNVIFTSDHGHAQIDGARNVMCIKDFIDLDEITYGELMIYTHSDDKAEEVYRKLTSAVRTNDFKVKIYKKEDFPERWHYTGLWSRIGEIILEPEVGWDIRFNCSRKEYSRTYGKGKRLHSATHGVSPDASEMHAVLVLNGPDIKSNQQIRNTPQNIDLYALMCHLLNIKPAPNNGSMSIFKTSVDFVNKEEEYVGGFIIIVVPLIGIVLMIIIYPMMHCSKGCCTSPQATEERTERRREVSYNENSAESATADRSKSQ